MICPVNKSYTLKRQAKVSESENYGQTDTTRDFGNFSSEGWLDNEAVKKDTLL